MQPTRVLDTRTGLGAPTEMLAPGKVIRLAVPAAAAAGAASVVLNLTATGAGNGGWVKAWPCDEQVPATSVLNFARARTVANAVISKLGSGGVCLLTSTPVHLIADLTGWFVGGQDFNGSLPNRILDTHVEHATRGRPRAAAVGCRQAGHRCRGSCGRLEPHRRQPFRCRLVGRASVWPADQRLHRHLRCRRGGRQPHPRRTGRRRCVHPSQRAHVVDRRYLWVVGR